MRANSFWRRLLCFALCLALSAGLLCGCAGEQTAETETTTETGEPGETLRWSISADSALASGLTEQQRLTPLVTRAAGETQTKEYTIMVYVVGSNLESEAGYASADILEMLNSGLDGTKCNLLVYTGGSKSWELNIPSDSNTVWAMTEDGRNLDMVATTGEMTNMGQAATFLDFLVYAYNYYPAEHYGLICWDHGGGPLYGYGSDELFGHDSLTLAEMEEAMAASPFSQEKLDFMGFDACLMACLEVAELFSDYSRYLIASEETELGSGWDYSFLSVLNDTNDTQVLARRILETYEASMVSSYWQPEYTLSCMDLSQMDALMVSLESLYGEMTAAIANGGYNQVARSRNETKRFALGSASSLSSSYDLVDLGDLLTKLSSAYGSQTRPALVCLDNLVVDQVTNVSGANGVSLYFPYDNKNLYRNGGSILYSGCMDYEHYNAFVKAFTDRWLTGTTGSVWGQGQKMLAQEDCLTVTLTEDQLEDVASITYTVLQYDLQSDTYIPILANVQAEPDESGVLSISRNPDIFIMRTDVTELAGVEGMVWPAVQLDRESYVVLEGRLMTSAELMMGEIESVQMAFSYDGTEVTIQSILSVGDDALFFGKQDVDISNYSAVAYHYRPLYPTYDTQGELLSWEEWTNNGWYAYGTIDYEDSFRLVSKKLQETEGSYWCQIIMTDTYGNVIGTRLEELYTNLPYETVNMTLAEGVMSFHVYADHAEVVGFEPIEREESYKYLELDVTIPSSVSGVPVTVIGEDAFYGCMDLRSVVIPDTVTTVEFRAFSSCYNMTVLTLSRNLTDIGNKAFYWNNLTAVDLPDGLKTIGSNAFAGSDLEEVTLPESVSYIGYGAFYGCANLKAIHSSGDAYRDIGGVLFTADGKTLVAYPAGGSSEYTIPDGVETIGAMAFRNDADLTSVAFNEGLKEIGQLAFCDSLNLTAIDLPDSLQTIENGAFAASPGSRMQDTVKTIRIGANVSWIGREAFSGYRMEAFAVDEANQSYSSVNGCLMNKSGTKLIQAPLAVGGSLEIPQGVSYIGEYAFYSYSDIPELVLPDSVVSISNIAGIPDNLEKITVGSGLSDWQNLYAYGSTEIVISAENPYFTVVDGSVYSGDGTVLYVCAADGENFVIPQGVTTIAYGAFAHTEGIRTLTIPASVSVIADNTLQMLQNLESYVVESGNSTFASWDGLLYSKDGKVLLAAPLGRTGTIQVREGTVEIAYRAFYSGYNLMADTVVIPEGVTVIRDGNFLSVPYNRSLKLYLPGSLTDIHPDMLGYIEPGEVEIHAPAGSTAEAFAEERGFTVIND